MDSPDGRPLRVATYNVHGCVGTDGRRDPERVARVLREIDPDVVGLQEVASEPDATGIANQLRYFADATGLTAVDGHLWHRRTERYGNALLIRGEVLEARAVDLGVLGREPRGALDVDLACRGRRLRVVVTHLGLWWLERREQIRRILELLPLEDEQPVVVLGDFNEWVPGSRAIRLMERHVSHSRRIATWPSRRPIFALDRVWARPRPALLALKAHRSPLAERASDHLPVKAIVATRRARDDTTVREFPIEHPRAAA